MNTEASQPAAPPPDRRPWQFHLRDLLIWTAVFAVFLASMNRIATSDNTHFGIDDIPRLFWQYLPVDVLHELIGFGLLVVPLICIGASIWIAVRLFRHPGRPYALFLFLGYVLFLFSWTLLDIFGIMWFSLPESSSVRLLVTMSLSSLLSVVEVLVRRLGRASLITSLMAIGVSFGYHFFLVCAAVCAGC